MGLIPCRDCGWFHWAKECLAVGDCVRVVSRADSSKMRVGIIVDLFVKDSDLQIEVSFGAGKPNEILDNYRYVEHVSGLDVMIELI